jgi:hypothetical protein
LDVPFNPQGLSASLSLSTLQGYDGKMTKSPLRKCAKLPR